MLRFNTNTLKQSFDKLKFQYILCYGSTPNSGGIAIGAHDFNTSYVTVQPPCGS